MNTLPNDAVCEILGRTNAATVVSFARCCDAFARAVRSNRAGILACRRSQRSWDHDRVLADSRALFPDDVSRESRKVSDEQMAATSGHVMRWPEGANVHPTDVTLDFNFGRSSRIIERLPGHVLTAIRVPVMAERVRITIGGWVVLDIARSLLRALCPSDVTDVDLLHLTFGRGFPICALHAHNMVLLVDGACRVRVSYAQFPLYSPLSKMALQATFDRPVEGLVTTHSDAAVEAGAWHVLRPNLLLRAFLVVVTRFPWGELAEDALDTVSVRMAACEKTWSAECLRAQRWVGVDGVWQGLARGYVLPVVTTHDFCKCVDVRVKLDLRDGVDPASVAITLAYVGYNRMQISGGMAGLKYLACCARAGV